MPLCNAQLIQIPKNRNVKIKGTTNRKYYFDVTSQQLLILF